MTKSEIKKSLNNELVFEYVNSYSQLMCNYNLNRGTDRLQKHCNDLEEELLKRELLTAEQIKQLNV